MADIRYPLAAVQRIPREQRIEFDARFWVIMAATAAVAVILVFIPWNH